MKITKFDERIFIGVAYGRLEYLAEPSWDCGWYWGFGYLQNKNIHHHVDTIDRTKNLFDAIRDYYGDGLCKTLKDDKNLWTFCELMKTFYILKEAAAVLGRGGAHYTTNPCAEAIKNTEEVKRINEEVLPSIFDAIHDIFTKA